jgi:hypothetical protein
MAISASTPRHHRIGGIGPSRYTDSVEVPHPKKNSTPIGLARKMAENGSGVANSGVDNDRPANQTLLRATDKKNGPRRIPS